MVYAARTRLRPILMTSLAFLFGMAPLMVATGAGAEMRQSLGTPVFGRMLGVTAFGLIFTRSFIRWCSASASCWWYQGRDVARRAQRQPDA